jgi:hypothetical protein
MAKSGNRQWQGDIIKDGTIKQELMILEDDPNIAPDAGHLSPGNPIQVRAIEEYLALAGAFHQDD